MPMMPIQATMTGYSGKPATLFAGYDTDSRVLACSVEAAYRVERHGACAIITNDSGIQQRDMLFREADLADAIVAFYALMGGIATDGKSARLIFSDKAQRANPIDSIDKDGIGESGQKYRISDAVSNGKMATLAACWYAVHFAGTYARTRQAHKHMTRLELGDVFTI
ncbi:MAG: hypothetical protein ACR2HF_13875 [Methylococcaceae bacterium]